MARGMLMHGDPRSKPLKGEPPLEQNRYCTGRALCFPLACNSFSPLKTFGVIWGPRSLLMFSWMSRPASFLPSCPSPAQALPLHLKFMMNFSNRTLRVPRFPWRIETPTDVPQSHHPDQPVSGFFVQIQMIIPTVDNQMAPTPVKKER